MTKKAIREFQKLSGLTIDGLLGPQTKAALALGEESYIDIGEGDVSDVNEIVYSKEVEDAQIKLKDLNLYTGLIDGLYGVGTKNAVKEFQRLANLSIDGVLGPMTLSALEKGENAYVINKKDQDIESTNNQTPASNSNSNLAVDLRNYNPNATCIAGYVNDNQIWVPDPCFYPVFVFRYGQTVQVNSQAELDAYLNQNWSLEQEKVYENLE